MKNRLLSFLGTALLLSNLALARPFGPGQGEGLTLFGPATAGSGGISSVNGLTDSVQTFATGTSGTDFAISSSSGVHTFNIPTASSSNRGLLSSTDWSTFNGKQAALSIGNLTSSTTGLTVTGGTGAIIGSGVALSIQTASGSQPGLLSSADWTTFNGKQAALTIGNLTSGTTGVTVTGGTGAVIGSGTSVSVQTASGSQPGLLSSADWTTFNGKQAAGNYITALTGDVTASGPGSASATISSATVKSKIYAEYDAGNSGTSKTLDFDTNGLAQKLTLTGSVTLTFTAPSQSGSPIVLRVVQDGTGGRTVTWPAAVKWAGGSAPTVTSTASKMDLFNFYYDGTNYYGSYSQNYTP